MKKAVVIVACERDLYFEECAKHLSKNNLEGWDVIVSVDGEKYVELFKTMIDAKFRVNPTPLGCGRHMITLRQELYKTYDRVLLVDDDITLAPTFLEVSEKLLDWGLANFNNVGCASGSSYWVVNTETKKQALGKTFGCDDGGATAIMPKETWQKIEPIMLEYLELIPGDYRQRDGVKIDKWMKEKCEIIKNVSGTFYPLNVKKELFTVNNTCFSQDKAHALALFINGLASVATYVPYLRNIGAIGLHSNQEFYDQSILPQVTLDCVDIPKHFYQ